MIVQPDDTVKIYKTSYNRVKDKLVIMHKDNEGNGVAWNLAAHPDDLDADLIASVQMK